MVGGGLATFRGLTPNEGLYMYFQDLLQPPAQVFDTPFGWGGGYYFRTFMVFLT